MSGSKLASVSLLGLLIGSMTIVDRAQAQVRPDQTLGSESSTVRNDRIRGRDGIERDSDVIEGGAQRGSNLFHSFEQFDVPENRGAYFANPADVQNIFSRVTGSDRSEINGTLGVLGDANLFFMNPNGILFGPSSSLDLGGSFVGTTASRFTFADGSEFSSVNPQFPPLLQVSVPLGLQYGSHNAGATISNRGNLTVEQDVSLIASILDLQGQLQAGRDLTLQAQETLQIRDTVTSPFLTQAGGNLTIQGNQGIDILALNHPQISISSGGYLRLLSDGVISGDAHFSSGGSFFVLNLAGNPGNFVSLYGPIIYANSDVTFGDYTGAALKVEATGSINGGNIRITEADTAIPVTDSDYPILSSRALILRAGLVSVPLNNLPQTEVGNPPTDFTEPLLIGQSRGSIDIGNVDTSNQVAVGDAENGGSILLEATSNIQTGNIDSRSFSESGNAGNGGAIVLTTTRGSIYTGDIRSYSYSDSSGSSRNGGSVSLNAPEGSISNNLILSYSFSEMSESDNGGNIHLNARHGISVREGLSSMSYSRSSNSGDGGDITVSTNDRNVFAGFLDAFSASQGLDGNSGNGGNITLSAGNSIATDDINAISSSNGFQSSGSSGNGGNITLSAGNNIETGDINAISSSDGSRTSGNSENGGNVILSTRNGDILTEDIDSGSSSRHGNAGNGGNIILTAGSDVSTEDLSTSSFSDSGNGTGNGGSVTINTINGSISTDDLFSSSKTESGNSGNGGNITFTAREGDISAGSGIRIASSEAESNFGNSGNGGNITFTARGNILSKSQLESSSFAGNFFTSGRGNSGDAGNIIFTTTNGNIITDTLHSSASSRFSESGNGGTIALIAPRGSILASNLNSSSALYFGNDQRGTRSGNGGAITLTANGEIRTDRVFFGSSDINPIYAPAASGALTVNSPGNIFLSELQPNGADTTIGNNAAPQAIELPSVSTVGGNFSLATSDSLTLRGTDINTSQATGDSGNIAIRTPGTLLLDQSRLFTSIEPDNNGTGGSITVEAGSVILSNFALIDTATFSAGDAGQVNIRARASISLNQSDVVSRTTSTGNAGSVSLQAGNTISVANRSTVSTAANAQSIGEGGDITLTTGSFSLTGGSQLQSFTEGAGNSGDIAITADNIVVRGIGIDGILSGVFTSTNTAKSGRGGDINIVTPGNLQITDGAVFSAETRSAGQGGTLSIRANSIELTNGGQLLASTVGSGQAGNIVLNAAKSVIISDPNSTSSVSQVPAFSCIVIGSTCGTNANPNIEFSTRIPHSSLVGEWGNGVDEYRITVTAPGTRAVFDIDNGGFATLDSNNQVTGLSQIDTVVSLLDSEGTVLARNDNANAFLGGEGSVSDRQSTLNGYQAVSSSRDSYLRFVFTEPGIYTVQVSKQTGIFERVSWYTLQVSLESPAVTGSVIETNPASGLFARTQGSGTAGNISINTPNLTLRNGAQINASTATGSGGRGGNITVNAPDRIILSDNSELSVETNGAGRAGDVTLTTNNLAVDQAARITATATSNATTTERGGSITLNANQMNLAGTVGVFSETQGVTPAGTLTLRPTENQPDLNINLQGGAEISASTTGSGQGGSLILTAPDTIMIRGNGQLAVEARGAGNAGNVIVTTDNLTLADGAIISATATETAAASARGGSLLLNVDRLNLSGTNTGLSAATSGSASAGELRLNPNRGQSLLVNLTDNASLSAATSGSGRGGNLIVTAPDAITVQGNGQLSTAATNSGDAGNLSINANTLTLRDRTQFTAATNGSGNAGNINFRTADRVSINRSSVSTEVGNNSTGNGGNINIQTGTLDLNDRSNISSSTAGQGDTGEIAIHADDRIRLDDHSQITSEVQTRATGNSQQITLRTPRLNLTDNSRISAATDGRGQAGDIRVLGADQVSLNNSTISTEVGRDAVVSTSSDRETQSSSQSHSRQNFQSNITINSRSLDLDNNAQITASTRGQGQAGNITVNANTVGINNGSRLTTSTGSDRSAGNIVLNVQEATNVSGGSGIFASTTANGNGGSITLNTDRLNLDDRARISARSTGSGTAGDIRINTENLNASDSTLETAATRSSGGTIQVNPNNRTGRISLNHSNITTNSRRQGGNISLGADQIILRGDSDLTTSSGGNGGNINLTAASIIAFDDSDILANSSNARGGNITLDTPAFFGSGYVPDQTTDELDGNDRVDVNATGNTASGTIRTPDTSFIQNSLSDLPINVIDSDQLLANSCIARTESGGTFLVTGLGGLPESPDNPIASTYPTGEVRSIPVEAPPQSHWQSGDAIVEPQGVYRLPDGRLVMSRECEQNG